MLPSPRLHHQYLQHKCWCDSTVVSLCITHYTKRMPCICFVAVCSSGLQYFFICTSVLLLRAHHSSCPALSTTLHRIVPVPASEVPAAAHDPRNGIKRRRSLLSELRTDKKYAPRDFPVAPDRDSFGLHISHHFGSIHEVERNMSKTVFRAQSKSS